MKDIAIFGVGGFGREVLTLIQDINRVSKEYNILGFFDDGHNRGEMVNGYPVLGKMDELNQWSGKLCLAVSIGNPKVKKSVIDRIVNPHVSYPTLIHPSVLIGDKNYVKIGQGCIICAGNIITTNIRVGNYVIMNLSCTTGHDSIIGDYSAFMPSVNISGEVIVGDGVYVGTGVKIINQVVIGEYATIGAGAVVVRNVPGYCTAVGVPAKVLNK
jgi:sugar O-acyltransferase (sialic acid O-acetyltransferase NeuD family)